MRPDESCVTVNTLHDLEQALKDSDRVVAMVYVTWCPYCRKALPVFENALYAQLVKLGLEPYVEGTH